MKCEKQNNIIFRHKNFTALLFINSEFAKRQTFAKLKEKSHIAWIFKGKQTYGKTKIEITFEWKAIAKSQTNNTRGNGWRWRCCWLLLYEQSQFLCKLVTHFCLLLWKKHTHLLLSPQKLYLVEQVCKEAHFMYLLYHKENMFINAISLMVTFVCSRNKCNGLWRCYLE